MNKTKLIVFSGHVKPDKKNPDGSTQKSLWAMVDGNAGVTVSAGPTGAQFDPEDHERIEALEAAVRHMTDAASKVAIFAAKHIDEKLIPPDIAEELAQYIDGNYDPFAKLRVMLDEMVGEAVRAFGEEVQARRPGGLDDETAEEARLRGELHASLALRVAAASSPEILDSALARLSPFVPAHLIDGWIRKATGRG